MSSRWVYEGQAWVFGDDVGVDGDLMPLHFALTRETDPQVLAKHLFAGLDKEFAQKCRPGDLIVGGRRFAQGNPHIQGLLGIRGAGLGLLAESIPSASLRNAVNAGVAVLPSCPGIREHVATGDRLSVDFGTGQVRNMTTAWASQFRPLPEVLMQIVSGGGWEAHFRSRLHQGSLRSWLSGSSISA